MERARLEKLRQRLTATPRRRRLLKVLAVLFGLWLLTSLFAWLAGPRLLTHWATGYVQEEFGHALRIDEVSINPLKLALTVRGLSLEDDQARPLVGFRVLVVDVDVTSAFRAMAILDEFRLDGLKLNIERLDADRFNFSNLADRLAARFAAQAPAATAAPVPEEKGSSLYFLVRHTEINDAALRFADHTRQPLYESTVSPLNLRMDDLTSRPDREAPYSFTATLGAGGTLSWQGDLTLEPLRSKGTVTLAGFGLSAAYDYVKDSFGFALPSGTMDVRVDYFADFSGKQSVLRVDDGRVAINGLSTATLDDVPLFAFDATEASGIRADIMNSTATVGRLETRGGRVTVMLDEGGRSNIERALVPRVAPAAASPAPATVPAAPVAAAPAGGGQAGTVWKVELGTLAVLDYAVDFTDRSTEPDARVQLSGVDFEATGIRLPELPAVSFSLAGNLGDGGDAGGAFAARGQYTLEGGVIDSDLQLTRLPLTVGSPYLAGVGRLTLLAGTADWNGHVRATRNGAGALELTGSGRLAGVGLRDDVNKARLASLAELSIEGMVFRQPDSAAGARPSSLALRRLGIAGLDVEVALDRRGVSNLQQVFSAPATATATAPAATPRKAPPQATAAVAPPMTIRLDSLVLRNNTVNFRDASPDLSFSARVEGFGGRVDGLSSDPAKRAKVSLDGTINRYAPLSITGEINPLAAQTYTDLRVKLASLDLSALTPYTVTYIAYPLERGKLGVELDWKVAERRFDSQNRVLIDGLSLGERREAPRATKLPVKLGIALLTNRDGDADLSVPAYGELDDPQFRYGKVILKALGNLITRAATSPFAALGNLGGGEKPDAVPFAAGSADLAAGEGERLGRMAQALADRPLLSVSITGTADTVSDRVALQQRELELRLKRAWLDSPFRRGQTVDEVSLDEERRDALLGRLYREGGGDPAALRDATGKVLPASEQRAVMERHLLAGIPVDDGALRELARLRSQQVKDRLLAAGVGEARVVIVDGAIVAGESGGARLALDAR